MNWECFLIVLLVGLIGAGIYIYENVKQELKKKKSQGMRQE